MNFVIHWNETAMGLHVFPVPILPSHLPLHPLPLGFPSAPGPRACLMHPTWAVPAILIQLTMFEDLKKFFFFLV